MYVCKMLPTSREEHKALNGKIFRADDPFWDAFYPPNGWNCRCDVIPLSKDEIDKIEHYTLQPDLDDSGNQKIVKGIPQYKRVKTKPEICQSDKTNLKYKDAQVTVNGRQMKYKKSVYTDPTTGIETSTDRGWNYNPGKAMFYEPDLSKYDDEFKAIYLNLKKEFEENLLRQNLSPIRTFDDEIALLAKMGISVVNADENKSFILHEINEAFSYLQADFKPLSKDEIPDIIEFNIQRFKDDFGADYKKYVAGYDEILKKIFINPDAKIFVDEKSLNETVKYNFKNKFWSSNNNAHFILHEYYHYELDKKNKSLFLKLKKVNFSDEEKNIIREYLGQYATINGVEFYSEYKIRELLNFPIDNKVKVIYDGFIKN